MAETVDATTMPQDSYAGRRRESRSPSNAHGLSADPGDQQPLIDLCDVSADENSFQVIVATVPAPLRGRKIVLKRGGTSIAGMMSDDVVKQLSRDRKEVLLNAKDRKNTTGIDTPSQLYGTGHRLG